MAADRVPLGVKRAVEAINATLDKLELTEPQKFAALQNAYHTQRDLLLRERMDAFVEALEDLYRATRFEVDR
jgi:ribosomal 50S subunit-associated protein YjgA (DUF615 family)